MVQVAQIGGRGGGGGEIGAMPKRKHLFFQEGFPYSDNNFIYEIQGDQHLLLENTLAPLQLIFLTLATRWMLRN